LLNKGYEVHGIIRRASTFNTGRIDHIYVDPNARLILHYGDLSDSEQISSIIFNMKPDEVYQFRCLTRGLAGTWIATHVSCNMLSPLA